jgi:thiol-disulfide isomerase/thioredoxin
VRIVPCVIVLAGLCLGSTGCSLFNKRPATGDRPVAASKDDMPFKPPEPQPVSGRGPTDAELGGLLAGRVIDSFSNRPTDAYIRWVCLEDKEQETPVDVAVNPEGYFTIQGLKRGKHYKLVARARSGARMLAGVTYTEAPNVRVLITLNEDFASPNTPQIPSAPVYPGPDGVPKKATKKAAETQAGALAPAWQPGGDGLPNPTIGTPRPMAETGTPTLPTAPERMAQGEAPSKAAIKMEVPRGWEPGPSPPTPPTVATPNLPAAPVPSCVLVGNQLINFALRDLNGDPWEWKRNRRGKLVLIDFWSTTCVPCIHTVPHLRILQEKYGWAGLEVVAIANEKGNSHEERAHKVASLCSRLQTNYRLLLDGGNACPVRRDFGVQRLPTLVLVDENGWILWRHEGQLSSPNEVQDLELRIKRRLGVR